MVVKESSDELNPPCIADLGSSWPRISLCAFSKGLPGAGNRDLRSRVFAFAPGTWGSLVGIGVYFFGLQALTDQFDSLAASNQQRSVYLTLVYFPGG